MLSNTAASGMKRIIFFCRFSRVFFTVRGGCLERLSTMWITILISLTLFSLWSILSPILSPSSDNWRAYDPLYYESCGAPSPLSDLEPPWLSNWLSPDASLHPSCHERTGWSSYSNLVLVDYSSAAQFYHTRDLIKHWRWALSLEVAV